MTAQVADKFLFNKDYYSLIGEKGSGFFTPRSFGMESEMMSTACYRGYHALYELTDKELLLREFTLNEKNRKYLPIAGKKPEVTEYFGSYQDLSLKVNYSGKIRLAKDLLREFYIHMGFQKASAFETVYDITLDRGTILLIHNRSEEMKIKRGQFKEYFESGDIKKAIKDSFDLDMDLI